MAVKGASDNTSNAGQPSTPAPASIPAAPPGQSVLDAVKMMFVVLAIMVGLTAVLVAVTVRYGEWLGTVAFINGNANFSFRGLMIGMIPGIVFGLVDSSGLFVKKWADTPMTLSGAFQSYLTPVLPKDTVGMLGLSNAVSSTVSTYIAGMVAKILCTLVGSDASPLYAETLGVLLGCLLGTYLPLAIFRMQVKKRKSGSPSESEADWIRGGSPSG